MLRELIDFNIEVISKRYHFENDYDIGKGYGYVDMWISDVDKLKSGRVLLVVLNVDKHMDWYRGDQKMALNVGAFILQLVSKKTTH